MAFREECINLPIHNFSVAKRLRKLCYSQSCHKSTTMKPEYEAGAPQPWASRGVARHFIKYSSRNYLKVALQFFPIK